MSPEEWNTWRFSNATQEARKLLAGLIEPWEERSHFTSDTAYKALLTRPEEQIEYARLRGAIEGAKELLSCLDRPLADLIDAEEEPNEKD